LAGETELRASSWRRAAQDAQLPITVESFPSGAVVTRTGESVLGKTPHVIRVGVNSASGYELTMEGYLPERLDAETLWTDTGDGPRRRIFLKKRPAWSRPLGTGLAAAPSFAGRWLCVGTDDGQILCLDPTTQREVSWSVGGGTAQALKESAQSTPEGIYTVWNNSRVLRLKIEENSARRMTLRNERNYRLGSLAVTPLAVLDTPPWLVVGTVRDQVEAFPRSARAGDTALWTLDVPMDRGDSITLLKSAATAGAPVGADDLILGTKEGFVISWLANATRRNASFVPNWKVQVGSLPVVDILRVGERIAVKTGERGRVVFLDPATGKRVSPFVVDMPEAVFVASDGTVLSITPDGKLAALHGDEPSFTPVELGPFNWPSDWQPRRLIALPQGVGIVCSCDNEDEGLLVFDASNRKQLRFRWSTQVNATIRFVTGDSHAVAVTTQAADNTSTVSLYTLER
jgi:hypothetical protein